MTDDDLRRRLVAACDKAGSQTAWAKANGLRPQYVSDVLNERREPSPKLARALGLMPSERQWEEAA